MFKIIGLNKGTHGYSNYHPLYQHISKRLYLLKLDLKLVVFKDGINCLSSKLRNTASIY